MYKNNIIETVFYKVSNLIFLDQNKFVSKYIFIFLI